MPHNGNYTTLASLSPGFLYLLLIICLFLGGGRSSPPGPTPSAAWRATEPPRTSPPASAGGGNASIEANLSLPQPCIAPIVFVTTPSGAWFAATGH